MNGFGVSSAVVVKAFSGARLVKGFNHLPASTLAADPYVNGGRRGRVPVERRRGCCSAGDGACRGTRFRAWGPPIFQDPLKK